MVNQLAFFLKLDDVDMTDCTGFSSISPFLPNGLYRIKLPVVGYVTALCVMDIDGGGWTVGISFTITHIHVLYQLN